MDVEDLLGMHKRARISALTPKHQWLASRSMADLEYCEDLIS